jgi:hypothetical protein
MVKHVPTVVLSSNGTNFHTWKNDLLLCLRLNELEAAILEDFAQELVDARQKKLAHCVIELTVAPELRSTIRECADARSAWAKLQDLFASESLAREEQLEAEINELQMRAEETALSYLSRAKELKTQLTLAGGSITDRRMVSKFLRGLTPPYKEWVRSMQAMAQVQKLGLDLESVGSALLEQEQTLTTELKANTQLTALAASAAPQKPQHSAKRNNPNIKCFNCGKRGHIARRCKAPKRTESQPAQPERHSGTQQRPQRPSGQAFMAHAETEAFALLSAAGGGPDRWLLDSGANVHLCCDRKQFTYLEDCEPVRITTAGAAPLVATAKGEVALPVLVSGVRTEVFLQDVLYVPAARVNLMSATKSMASGANLLGEQGRVKLVKEGAVRLEAVVNQHGMLLIEQPRGVAAAAVHAVAVPAAETDRDDATVHPVTEFAADSAAVHDVACTAAQGVAAAAAGIDITAMHTEVHGRSESGSGQRALGAPESDTDCAAGSTEHAGSADEQNRPDAEPDTDPEVAAARLNEASNKTQSAMRWHMRLGHVGFSTLERMASKRVVQGLDLDPATCKPPEDGCEGCLLGKHTRRSHSSNTHRAAVPLQLVHIDVQGPLPAMSMHGNRYMVVLVDDHSSACVVEPVASKAQVKYAVQRCLLRLQAIAKATVAAVRTDRGSELVNAELRQWLAEKNMTHHQTTAPYSPEQNGRVERLNRTLAERMRAMMSVAGAPDNVWDEAMMAAAYTYNRTALSWCDQTPWERLTGRQVAVSQLKVFGCRAWVHSGQRMHKLQPRSQPGIMLGYEMGCRAYRVLIGHRVHVTTDVKFSEHRFPWKEDTSAAEQRDAAAQQRLAQLQDDTDVAVRLPRAAGVGGSEAGTAAAAGDAGVGGSVPATIQPAQSASTPVADGSMITELGGAVGQDDAADDAAEGQQPPVQHTQRVSGAQQAQHTERRYPQRNRRPAQDWWRCSSRAATTESAAAAPAEHSTNSTEAEAPDSADDTAANRTQAAERDDAVHDTDAAAFAASDEAEIKEPRTYAEAMASPQRLEWLAAMEAEMDSLQSHETWTVERTPAGVKPIPVRWVFKVKRDEHGRVQRYKARLVAKGFHQQQGVDYDEVFAPTSKFSTLRMMLAEAAVSGNYLAQLDIKTAFLYGELRQRVYVQEPPGFESGLPCVCCRLHKALYGLKQAPRAWYEELCSKLGMLGFKQSVCDPALYVLDTEHGREMLLDYVDDMLLSVRTPERAMAIKSALSQFYELNDLGEPALFLGMQLCRVDGFIYLHQHTAIRALIEQYGLTEARTVSTPLDPGCKLQPLSKDDADERAYAGSYASLVGSLLWLANTCRPDIAYAVGVLGRYTARPGREHWNAAMHVLRYLKGTADWGLRFDCAAREHLRGYSDADYAGETTARSTSGYVFKYNGGTVMWSSKLQRTVATSTQEAEYIASASAIKEALFLARLQKELEYAQAIRSVLLYVDNQAALTLLKHPVISAKSKHINVAHHFCRYHVSRGDVCAEYVRTEEQAADIMTKALKRSMHERGLQMLGVVRVPGGSRE